MDGVDTQLEQTKIIDLFIKKRWGLHTASPSHCSYSDRCIQFPFGLCVSGTLANPLVYRRPGREYLVIQCRVFSAENFVARVGILQYYQEVPTRRLCCFVRCEF